MSELDVYPELEQWYANQKKQREAREREVLAAFRTVTNWTDDEVIARAEALRASKVKG